jgi:hypothetical protein
MNNSKSVYKIKTTADVQTDRYKARLVAKGFKENFGLHYENTFSYQTDVVYFCCQGMLSSPIECAECVSVIAFLTMRKKCK